MPAPSTEEVLRYIATGDEALFFAILDNPAEVVNGVSAGWIKASLAAADEQKVSRLFHLLQNLKNQPEIQSLLLALMEDRTFQDWKSACAALFYNQSGDSLLDRAAISERLRRNNLADRASYWGKLEA